ncbi:hypothetical protein RFI_01314 [Reticulomyxa filosa]|uniref:Uncharacterized protein n=1 Tax=Reticulomyxa filosa TaxID=46433 RepID=X6PDK3_RETFI|nr:hypothetical protein RFI_01314 [Reticulomyxa filosa]|eukprot:ETO35747.1 hypothetical protein RFI_01314 [Reticulomyxa filosa]
MFFQVITWLSYGMSAFLFIITMVYLSDNGKIEGVFYDSQSYLFVVMLCLDLPASLLLLYLFTRELFRIVLEKDPLAMGDISNHLLHVTAPRKHLQQGIGLGKENENYNSIVTNSTSTSMPMLLGNQEDSINNNSFYLSNTPSQSASNNKTKQKVHLSQIQDEQMQLKLFRNLIRYTNLSVLAIISSTTCELFIALMLIRTNNFQYSNVFLMGIDACVATLGVSLSMGYSESTYRKLCNKFDCCYQKFFIRMSGNQLRPHGANKSRQPPL